MMHDWGFGWGGGMFFGPLFMIGGPILIIVLLIVLTRWLTDSRDTPRVRLRTPREILDECFARGEMIGKTMRRAATTSKPRARCP